jgi:hypothetical protein
MKGEATRGEQSAAPLPVISAVGAGPFDLLAGFTASEVVPSVFRFPFDL